MKTTLFQRISIIMLILALASISCSFGSTPLPEATPIPTDTEEPPTDTPEPPTDTPEPPPTDTPIPEETPTPEPQDFFTEEFDGNLENWDVFYLGKGDSSKTSFDTENEYFVVDMGHEDVYAYFYYTPYVYTDVALRINAENRGRNNNNVSLTCRMSQDGWYEFSVESGGIWYLYAVTDDYHVLAKGGVKSLNIGQATNEYGMICQDYTITVSVNDVELNSITDKIYLLGEGNVGFNISSLNVLPIVVAVDWFEISQP